MSHDPKKARYQKGFEISFNYLKNPKTVSSIRNESKISI